MPPPLSNTAHVPVAGGGADRAGGGHRAPPGLPPRGASPTDAGRAALSGQRSRLLYILLSTVCPTVTAKTLILASIYFLGARTNCDQI